MLVENVMYFALGLLLAGLVGLMVMPAVWQRAVRLTKKRIEAATPITMAEFRADKDQLRAEFALSTRRLEMHVEALRRRLADQLRDVNRRRADLSGIKGERDNHARIVRELEEREAELRRRVLELEKEGADLTQKLRMRERDYTETVGQLEATKQSIDSNRPGIFVLDGRALSGRYNDDMKEVLQTLENERRRASFLESQNRSLLRQLEFSDGRSASAVAAAAELRASLNVKDDVIAANANELVEAEARLAEAEVRVAEILEQTQEALAGGEQQRSAMLADRLTLEEEVETLRRKVLGIEETIMADWTSERIEQAHLRERLNDVATEVSRLVFAMEGIGLPDPEESLFNRVRRYADDGVMVDEFTVSEPGARNGDSAVSDRLAAIRELQGRD